MKFQIGDKVLINGKTTGEIRLVDKNGTNFVYCICYMATIGGRKVANQLPMAAWFSESSLQKINEIRDQKLQKILA